MHEMELLGVREELISNTSSDGHSTLVNIVILREIFKPGRLLPIFIAMPEARSIAVAVAGLKPSRPLTHDLLHNVIEKMPAELERVVVTELRGNTFYAEIHMTTEDGLVVFSSRPSDAIALAVRTGSPIYATESALTDGGYFADAAYADSSSDDSSHGHEGAQGHSEEQMLEQFKDFLDTVSPEDFSY